MGLFARFWGWLTGRSAPAAPAGPTVLRGVDGFKIPISPTLMRLGTPEVQAEIRRAIASIGDKPTADQWGMILAPAASSRVIAGAGSGKSTTLILRVTVLHKILGIPLSEMRVFSFTRASTQEFQEKLASKLAAWEEHVEGRVVDDRRRQDLLITARGTVSTFHSAIARLRSSVYPEKSNTNFFDLLSDRPPSDEEVEGFNPLLASKLSAPQLEALHAAHDLSFKTSERYRNRLNELMAIEERRMWLMSTEGKVLKSESEPYFWSLMLNDERLYHGYTADRRFAPRNGKADATGGIHVDAQRAAVADRLRALGASFVPLAPFQVQCPIAGVGDGELLAAFRIGEWYLHVERKINYSTEKKMWFQQRDRKKFIALYCRSFERHKALRPDDFVVDRGRLSLTPDADLRLQQWIGLQNRASGESVAPPCRLKLVGDFYPSHIAEILYREGCFLESLGVEVADLPVPTPGAILDEAGPAVAEVLKIFWVNFNAVLSERGHVRFHDVLSRLRVPERLDSARARIQFLRHQFIDEFQDISPEIAEWLKKATEILAKDGEVSLTSVGDDYQSIYGWRGSSPTYLMDYERLFPAKQMATVMLNDNFRSRQSIIDAAEKVMAQVTQKVHKSGVSVIRHVERTADNPIAIIGNLEWNSDPGIWGQFTSHVIGVLGDLKAKGHAGALFGKKSDLSILILSRTNAALEEVPAARNLEANFLDVLARSGWHHFQRVSVRSLTFHRSKGLEADFVLLLEDCEPPGEHPFRNFVYRVAKLPGTYTLNQTEESRRLAYVALSRARYGLMWVHSTLGASGDNSMQADGCFATVQSHIQLAKVSAANGVAG